MSNLRSLLCLALVACNFAPVTGGNNDKNLLGSDCSPACNAGETCTNSKCLCDPTICQGCCASERCLVGTEVDACGKEGSICGSCDATTKGPLCLDGSCGCTRDAQCAESLNGPTCRNESCGCESSNDCPDGQVCTADKVCRATGCDATHACKNSCCNGGSCIANDQCPGGVVCGADGACPSSCGPNAHCRTGCCANGTCSAGTDVASCGSDGTACAECLPGSACTGAGCQCTDNSQCPEGKACRDGACSGSCSGAFPCRDACCDGGTCVLSGGACATVAAPLCLPAQNACGCDSTDDCAGSGFVCDSTNSCVSCLLAGAPACPNGNYCDSGTGKCKANATCPGCINAGGMCIAAVGATCCTTSAQCANNLACNTSTGACETSCTSYTDTSCKDNTYFCNGNACTAKLGAGDTCGTQQGACQAGLTCVDTVCCTTACNGLCEQCNVPGSLGSCVGATTDSACGTVDCPNDVPSTCTDYTADLVNQCKSKGVCKTAADCTATAFGPATTCRPASGECDVAEVCDGVNTACPTNTYATGACEDLDDCNGADTCSSGVCSIHAWSLVTPCPKAACFVAGTPIRLADDTDVPIESLHAGQLVRTYDVESRTYRIRPILRTFAHAAEPRSMVVIGDLVVTEEHPIFANGRFVAAGNLSEGDQLMGLANDRFGAPVVTRMSAEVMTYNLEVEGEHDYFAAGLLVHNKPVDPTPESECHDLPPTNSHYWCRYTGGTCGFCSDTPNPPGGQALRSGPVSK